MIPLLNQAPIFLAVAIRVTGLVLVAPLLSHSLLPPIVKVGLVVAIATVIFPFASAHAVVMPEAIVGYVVLAVRELVIGLIIGLAAMLFFSACYIAGELVATQMGLNFATVAGAEDDPQLSVLSTFNYMLALLLLLAVNGHHWFFQAIAQSYQAIPVGHFNWSGVHSEKVVDLFTMVFAVGFKMAAPALAVLLTATMGMVVLARILPQMNIFVIGLPVRLGIGLIVLGVFMPVFVYAIGRLFVQMRHDMIFLMG